MMRIDDACQTSGASTAVASRQPLARVWHVGGEDMDLRIPLLLKLRERGYEVTGTHKRRQGDIR